MRRTSERWLIAMATIVSGTTTYAQSTRVDTALGELEIAAANRSEQCVAKLGGNVIRTFDCSASFQPAVVAHYRGPIGRFSDVLVIQERPMGNACNGGPLHVVGLEKPNRISTPEKVDFCGGADPVVRRAGSQVMITLPGGPSNRGAGRVPTEVWTFDNGELFKRRASTSASRDDASAGVPTITMAGQTKVTVATVRKITDGDVACYLELVDDSGRRYEEMGEYTFCGKRDAYLGRRVRLSYGVQRVIHEDCMGNPECRKTRQAVMITSATVLR